MLVAMTKMSSRGQVVIPLSMRGSFMTGDSLVVMCKNDKLVIKKMLDTDNNFKEDIEFARRTEEAYRRVERGEFRSMSGDDFLKELETWWR